MKLPFEFNLKLFFRLLLPGFLLAIGFFPLIKTLLDHAWKGISDAYILTFSAIILGWLVVVLDMPIYIAFEGRRYWPKFLWNLLIDCENKRLNKLIAKTRQKDDWREYLESSVEIRRFPMNKDGEYEVRYPTRLGNLVAAYEDYPDRIYGMDPIFYWPRIWLTLDKELREEIDGQQAIADSVIYVSASLLVCSLLYVIYATLQSIGSRFIDYAPAALASWGIAITTFALAYMIYNWSFHIHYQFGETFKSTFDLYHVRLDFNTLIDEISELTNSPEIKSYTMQEKNRIIWRYLHNYRVKIPEKDSTISPQKLKSLRKL